MISLVSVNVVCVFGEPRNNILASYIDKIKGMKKKKKKVRYETETEKPNTCPRPVVICKHSFLHLVSVMTLVRLRTLLCYQDCSSLNFCDQHLFALQSIDRSNIDLVCDIIISKKKGYLNLILKFCYHIWTMQLEDDSVCLFVTPCFERINT